MIEYKYRMVDFYNKEEYSSFLALMKNVIIQDILTPIAIMFPKTSLIYVGTALREGVEFQNDLGGDPLKIEIANVLFAAIRNHSGYLHKILANEMKKDPIDQELSSLVHHYLQLVFSFVPNVCSFVKVFEGVSESLTYLKTQSICISQISIITSSSIVLPNNQDAVVTILKKVCFYSLLISHVLNN